MKDSEVYLRAAEWLDENPGNILAYACLAAVPEDNHQMRCARLREWLGDEYIDCGDRGPHSVLALLFMHHIAKDEEKA